MRRASFAATAAGCTILFLCPAQAQEITGRVVEDHSGTPLASVEIRIQKSGATRLAADLETAADGTFQLPQLAAGDYRFEFSKSNYITTAQEFRGSLPSRISARLVRMGSISGRVIDLEGHPTGNAVVYAIPKPRGTTPPRPLLSQGAYALPGPQGDYRLYYLPPGEYMIAASYGASSMVLGMTGSAAVNPAIGSGVAMYPSSARPEYLAITGGEEYRNIDFRLASGSFYSVSGKVDLSSIPPKSAGNFWLTLAPTQQPSLASAATTADRNGVFRFDGIAPGSYFLLGSGPSTARDGGGAYPPEDSYFIRVRVEVVADNISGLVLKPQKGITAQFRLNVPPETRKGCPESAELALTPLEDWSAHIERKVTVTATNNPPLTGLAPARYAVTAGNLGRLCYQSSELIIDAASAPDTTVINLAAAGAIRGKLIGTSQPSDVSVALLSFDPLSGQNTVLSASPDSKGAFAFDALRPGKYFIAAQPGSGPKSRWLVAPDRMLEIEIRGGSITEMELPVAATEGSRQ